jgi:DNA polymerase, archaea type
VGPGGRHGGRMSTPSLVGLWLDKAGTLHLARRAGGERRATVAPVPFRPFAWASAGVEAGEGVEVRELSGPGRLNRLLRFSDVAAAREPLKAQGRGWEVVRPFEHQYLLQSRERLFGGLRFADLRRCQLDIETACGEPGSFPDAARPEDRVLAIGLQLSGEATPRLLRLAARTEAAERALLQSLNEVLAETDPDTLEGHNLFNFDLAYLRDRCRLLKVPCRWGRVGGLASFRASRLRVAERWLDFTRCEIPGRTVFDTYLALQLYDVANRDLPDYRLKTAARYFGITTEEDGRTYIPGDKIQFIFEADPERFDAYLADDLRETRGLADRLLPTYLAQVQSFPMLLQEACLRGTGVKVDLVLLERYLHAEAALPDPAPVSGFEGGFSRSYGEGVFHRVLHFDVASLYPSLLLQIGRNPANDALGVLVPLLAELRRYRLEYKQKARSATDPMERAEFQARQASFKVLINSFYGYLGFPGARFADSELAAEVTRRGRELLQGLIAWFEGRGLRVLEADTDGLYVEAPDFYDAPETLLEEAQAALPEGIELELDGRFPAMFCYKAKNYALYDGEHVKVRGSALRSRGTEPFLKELTDRLIAHQLGLEEEPPETLLRRLAESIRDGSLPVARLARSEYLSMNPRGYAEKMAAGGKPRRAALEVALRMEPPPRMGEKVRYFLGPREKGQSAEWQRARPLAEFNEVLCPYDPNAYLKKLQDWRKRYDAFLADE